MAASIAKQTEGADTGAKVSLPPAASELPLSAEEMMLAATLRRAADAVATTVQACARWCGVWPDGVPFDEAETDWRRHAQTDGLVLPPEDTVMELWLGGQMLSRINTAVRQHGHKTGYSPDGLPYTEGDPDAFALSVNFGTGVNRPAAGEKPGPPGLPWCIVRRPP